MQGSAVMKWTQLAEIVAQIRVEFEAWRKKNFPELDSSWACFHWSIFGASRLRALGYDAYPCGGSLSWPHIDLSKDDGVQSSHFSYMWEPNSETTSFMLSAGLMPEMHVWIWLRDKQEIVDLTTCYLKQQMAKLTDMEWLADDPPDFLWCKPNELPKGVYYEPAKSAEVVIRLFCERTWGSG